MNNLLELRGSFDSEGGRPPSYRNMPKNKSLYFSHIEALLSSLRDVLNYWANVEYMDEILISTFYDTIISKSNRIESYFKSPESDSNSKVVGTRFSNASDPNSNIINNGETKYIVTYLISEEDLLLTIERLERIIEWLRDNFENKITYNEVKTLQDSGTDFGFVTRTDFYAFLADSYYITEFGVLENEADLSEDSLITLYETGNEIIELLRNIGIDIPPNRKLSDLTVLLRNNEIEFLKSAAPELISMAIKDFSELDSLEYEQTESLEGRYEIDENPLDEPVIGVIDTMFDEDSYFSEWVDFRNTLDPSIPIDNEDYYHGTAVTSIIVDGPRFNPHLQDNCGNFRVRHFGVATQRGFSSFEILKTIKEVVSTNLDIKVWNLSLGSTKEINDNFVSPEAAILDEIQHEYDVIFVIAGTNKNTDNNVVKIGSPADSINSLVVNSVKLDGNPASYTREGPVLSFYKKPDISYYGGDRDEPMIVAGGLSGYTVYGTSYAAPWVSRKLSFLIQKIGMSREVAKALLIDSAISWENKKIALNKIGYGILPKKIEDIINSSNDEIKFFINGSSRAHKTYNFNLPLPQENNEFPYVVKTTLVSFPECSRNHGVDYTNTELNLRIGMLNKTSVKTVNDDLQNVGGYYTYEQEARKHFRKWDNVKVVNEGYSTRKQTKKPIISEPLWGLEVKAVNRNGRTSANNLKYGIVVTFKEINGRNRIGDFKRMARSRGWLVNEIDIVQSLQIYNQAHQDIEFE